MKIILELENSIDDSEAQGIAEYLENEPWCRKAEVVSGCGNGCSKGKCGNNQIKQGGG